MVLTGIEINKLSMEKVNLIMKNIDTFISMDQKVLINFVEKT